MIKQTPKCPSTCLHQHSSATPKYAQHLQMQQVQAPMIKACNSCPLLIQAESTAVCKPALAPLDVQVMGLMELTSLKGSLVGLPGQSGLSVEQRKRLTIGVELVANPSIIFMVLLTPLPDKEAPPTRSAALMACFFSVSFSIPLPVRP